MPGVRIRPRPDRVVPDNALIVVRDVARPFPQPRDGRRLEAVQPVCRLCGVQHFEKTYHIQLQDGAAIVSTTIWEKLQGLVEYGGFEKVNVVEKPPAQTISIEGKLN